MLKSPATLSPFVLAALIYAIPRPAAAQVALPAYDVTAADVQAFIDALPKDRVSDLPIRIVDAGTHRVGVYGVFRPESVAGDANLHEVSRSEVYYMLEGAATLVTGGTLTDPRRPSPESTSLRGSGIEGGVSRRIVPGDIVIIPGGTPHWWSDLETDISYLIVRPDPDNVLTLR